MTTEGTEGTGTAPDLVGAAASADDRIAVLCPPGLLATTLAKLRRQGIRTVADLAAMDIRVAKKLSGVGIAKTQSLVELQRKARATCLAAGLSTHWSESWEHGLPTGSAELRELLDALPLHDDWERWLDPPVRCSNALRLARLVTLGEVIDAVLTRSLFDIRNFGKVSQIWLQRELLAVLRRRYDLGEEQQKRIRSSLDSSLPPLGRPILVAEHLAECELREILGELGDELFNQLASHGVRTVADLAREVGDPQSPVSRTLALAQRREVVHALVALPRADRHGSQTSPETATATAPEPGSGTEEALIEEAVVAALKRVSDRQRRTLSDYYGIVGEPRTLRELATALGLSHQRVSQIRSKALGRIARTIRHETAADELVRRTRLILSLRRPQHPTELAPAEQIWIDALFGGLRRWEDEQGPDESLVELERSLQLAASMRPFPRPLPDFLSEARRLTGGRVSSTRLERELEKSTTLHVYGGYLVGDQHPTSRTRAAVMAHAALQDGAPATLTTIDCWLKYRQLAGDDVVSPRVLGLAMAAFPNLFLKVAGGRAWLPLPPMHLGSEGRSVDEGTPLIASRLAGQSASSGSAVAALVSRFGSKTTSTDAVLSTLRRIRVGSAVEVVAAVESSGPRRAVKVNSAAAMLGSHPLVDRVAPGLYAFAGTELPQRHTSLLHARALRQYVLAAQLGEKRLFPLWTPEMERSWCIWAYEERRFGVSSDAIGGLSRVAEPSSWTSCPPDILRWLLACRERGTALERKPPVYDVPQIEELLVVAWHAVLRGRMTPVAQNILLGRAIEHADNAAIPEILELLGVLEGAGAPLCRVPTDYAPKFVDRLAAAFTSSRNVSWNSALGAELSDELADASRRGPTSAAFSSVLQAVSGNRDATSATDTPATQPPSRRAPSAESLFDDLLRDW